jgi:hypothetical protein
MTVVVVVVVRRGRAFSGGATAHVVGDVWGGRHDGPPRPFCCCTVMIVHTRAPGCVKDRSGKPERGE